MVQLRFVVETIDYGTYVIVIIMEYADVGRNVGQIDRPQIAVYPCTWWEKLLGLTFQKKYDKVIKRMQKTTSQLNQALKNTENLKIDRGRK